MATYDSILEEQRKKEQAEAQKIYEQRSAANTNMNNAYVADINKIVDQSTKNATDKIQNDIEKLPQQYQSAYDTNAIQQKINERQVAERMANLGLTDSGLNRTQQTAINIQRANADAALTQQKNAAINNLKEQIADVVASGELQKQQTAAESRYNLAQTNNTLYNNLMDNAESKAVSYANNWQEQQTAIQKERIQQQAAIEKAKISAKSSQKEMKEEYLSAAEEAYSTGGEQALQNYLNRLMMLGYSEEQLGSIYYYITSTQDPEIHSAKYNAVHHREANRR